MRSFVQLFFLVLFLALFVLGKANLWLVVFLVSLAATPLLGRGYCGYVCPMNTAMGWAAQVRRFFKLTPRQPGAFWRKRWLPWVLLLVGVALMLFSKRVLELDIPILLLLLLIASVWTVFLAEGYFHNFLCPFGAPLRLLARRPWWQRQVAAEGCISCGECRRVCPAEAVAIATKSAAKIDPALCHQCDLCSKVCPTQVIHYSHLSGKG